MNRHRHALQLIAQARPAVLNDAPARPAPSFPDPSVPVGSAGRATRRLVLAGLVPTVVALVAGVVVRSGGPAQPVTAQPVTAQPVTARAILLAAAEKTAAANAPATGDYWVTEVELDHVYDVGDYHVLGRTEEETWYPLRSRGNAVSVTRWLGAAPATDADQAAWRAAGSPTRWTLTGAEGEQSGDRPLPAAPGAPEVTVRPGDSGFDIGGTPLTYAQIRALPTEPNKLKAYLIKLDDAAGQDGIWTPGQIAKWRVEMLFSQSWTLLGQLPVAPAVRAATYRMLAGLAGLTVTENVRDAKGRTGAGISYAYRNANGSSVETRLVIDPDSGSLLANEQKSDASLLLDARFSDAAPPRS
jgi:hypothetical protein